MLKTKVKYIAYSTATALLVGPSVAYASTTTTSSGVSGISNPLAGSSATVGTVTNNGMNDVLYTVEALSGGWFLFHLYRGVLGWMAGAKNAQKREEAKSHLAHIAISGIVLGGAATFGGALINLGSKLGG